MARVWMAQEGSRANSGGPWREMTLDECQQKLGLIPSDFKSDLADPPHFGDTTKPPAMFRDPVAVVVEVDDAEAAKHGWKPGFYVLDVSPKQAEKRLGRTLRQRNRN